MSKSAMTVPRWVLAASTVVSLMLWAGLAWVAITLVRLVLWP